MGKFQLGPASENWRDAMSRERLIGLARVLLSSRERPFMIEPMVERQI
jgi:non-homologous end joining protein Ku